MTQSIVTIEGLTQLANDLIIQNTAIRNKLDKVETQRDELLEALEKLVVEMNKQTPNPVAFYKACEEAEKAIAKAKGE